VKQDLKGKRVLIVEDQYLVADDIRRVVEDLGGTVIGPEGRREGALHRIDLSGIDLAILDINLAGETAYPAADELRRRGIPFLFVTGYAPAAVRKDYGDVPHIEKPYDTKALKSALCELAAG
jgi:CheY-like chemotaxis protein